VGLIWPRFVKSGKLLCEVAAKEGVEEVIERLHCPKPRLKTKT
jgi:hypothetical protein